MDGEWKNGWVRRRYKFHLRDSKGLGSQEKCSGLWAPLGMSGAKRWKSNHPRGHLQAPMAPGLPQAPSDTYTVLSLA